MQPIIDFSITFWKSDCFPVKILKIGTLERSLFTSNFNKLSSLLTCVSSKDLSTMSDWKRQENRWKRRVDLKFFKHSSYILQLSHFIFQVVQVAPLIYFTLFTYCTAACYAVITAQGWNFASASDRPRNAPESSSSSSTVYGIQTCFFKRSYSSLKNWKTLKQKVRMSHTRRDVLALQILQKPGLYNSVQNTETTSFVSIFLSFNFKSSFLP